MKTRVFLSLILFVSPALAVPPEKPKSECWQEKSEGSGVYCLCDNPHRCAPRGCIEDDENQPSRTQGEKQQVTGKLQCIDGLAYAEASSCEQAMKKACESIMDKDGEPGIFGKKMLGEGDQEAKRGDRPNDSQTGCKSDKVPKIMGRFWPDDEDRSKKGGIRGTYGGFNDDKNKAKVPNTCSQIVNSSEDRKAEVGKEACYLTEQKSKMSKTGLTVWYKCVDVEPGAQKRQILTDEAGEATNEAPDKDEENGNSGRR